MGQMLSRSGKAVTQNRSIKMCIIDLKMEYKGSPASNANGARHQMTDRQIFLSAILIVLSVVLVLLVLPVVLILPVVLVSLVFLVLVLFVILVAVVIIILTIHDTLLCCFSMRLLSANQGQPIHNKCAAMA